MVQLEPGVVKCYHAQQGGAVHSIYYGLDVRSFCVTELSTV